MIHCTYCKLNSPQRKCNRTATDFYQQIPGVEIDFVPGSEGAVNGGFLARCASHALTKEQLHPMRANYMRIDVNTYVVGVVMEA